MIPPVDEGVYHGINTARHLPLDADDAAWAEALLRAAGKRH